MPQIEVTFDIDANGILNVSAKDLGTGTQQKITITASTNMTDEEIDKAIKEAEKFAAEDKKKRELIDAKNNADNMINQCEKTINELGDKVSEEEKKAVQEEVDKLKEVVKGEDVEAIKAATEAVTKKFYDISAKLYQQAGGAQQGQGPQGPDGGGNDNVVDAEYKVEDDK